jgi:hypothetical protein
MRVGAVAVLVIGAGLLTACEENGLGEAAKGVGTVQTVDCPGSARAVDLPAGFVAPLPRGTVVVDVRHGDKDRTVVTGVVPAEQKDVLAQLQKAYPAAGLTLTEGETEEHDAESNFHGNGFEGRWGIRELTDCSPTATRIDLGVAPLTS